MTDVFISYSRKDIAFARLLHQALIENDLETWIDWQDIPPSVDWLAEVYEAIEGADAFLFIISETSLDSEICGLEIAHAAKHNKRLIPIVIHDVEAEQVPKELSVLNWIFFDEAGEKFDRAMEDLVTAITVDQAWAKSHTRFQNRALDWERKDQDRGLLLRGAELVEAESWLSQAEGMDPQPTALQAQYILKSRENATRRQRLTLSAVGVGLVISIILGIFAWTQRNEAVTEGWARATAQAEAESAQAEAVAEAEMRATAQAEAEEQSRIAVRQSELALSRFLSTQSLAKREDQLDLALLLAVQAARISPTTDARGSLLAALTIRPYLEAILTQEDNVYAHSLGLSADGNTLAVSYFNRIEIWDLNRGVLLTELSTPEEYEKFYELTFVGGVEKLLGCREDDNKHSTSCRLWDIETGDDHGLVLTGIEQSNPRTDHILAVHPDRERALIRDEQEGISLFSLLDGEHILGPFTGHEKRVTSAAFRPDGEVLATGDQDGKEILWDLESGERIGNRICVLTDEGEDSPQSVTGLAFNPDGSLLLAAGSSKSVIFSPDTLRVEKRLSGFKDSDQILAFYTPDGIPVALVRHGKQFIIWNAATGDLLGGQPDLSFQPRSMLSTEEVFDPVHLRLITSSDLTNVIGTMVLVWDFKHRFPFERYFSSETFFETVAYHPTQPLLAAGGCREFESVVRCAQGEVRFWNPENGEQVREPLLHDSRVIDIAFNPDGRILATGSREGKVVLWNMESDPPLAKPLGKHQSFVKDLAFSPDGSLLASTAPDDPLSVRLWDLEQDPPIGNLLGKEYEELDSYRDISFSPDGNTLSLCGTGTYGARVTLWDISKRTLISHLATEKDNRAANCSAYTLDGHRLIAGGGSGLRIWDTPDYNVLAEPAAETISPPRIQSVSLSPDGQMVASVLLADQVMLWDGTTGQKLTEPVDLGAYGDIGMWGNDIIAYCPDGTQVAIVGDFGLLLWDMALEQWMDAACRMAGRNLTPEEWRTYLRERPYQKTCPDLP
jgi:WD40 repeat protein